LDSGFAPFLCAFPFEENLLIGSLNIITFILLYETKSVRPRRDKRLEQPEVAQRDAHVQGSYNCDDARVQTVDLEQYDVSGWRM
jgi:hypothetical protein